jgi:hypothetical protein
VSVTKKMNNEELLEDFFILTRELSSSLYSDKKAINFQTIKNEILKRMSKYIVYFNKKDKKTWPESYKLVLVRDYNGEYHSAYITESSYWCNKSGHCFASSVSVMWWTDILTDYEVQNE